MSLRPENISRNLIGEQKIWRYMSFDKLINLLDTNSLFFTSLSSYNLTDPFEGLLPQSFKDSIAQQIQDIYYVPEELTAISDNIFKILSSFTVNCWHQNNYESEAMWQLYSDNKKGVAIQSTISSLAKSITSDLKGMILLSEVQYLDLESQTPTLPGFEGPRLLPIYKRLSFKHEHEARLLYADPNSIKNPSPSSHKIIDIDPFIMIEKIYISPYAPEPYGSSVIAVLKKYGVSENNIIKSQLLTPNNSLKRLF